MAQGRPIHINCSRFAISLPGAINWGLSDCQASISAGLVWDYASVSGTGSGCCDGAGRSQAGFHR